MSVATSRSWLEPPNPLLLLAEQFDPSPHPYAARPVEFASDILGFTAWSKQREIMEAVRDHSRVAVRSSHGPGKTAIAARVGVTFLATHPNSRVITTAPTWAQVEQQLWREVRAAVASAHLKGHELAAEIPEPTATKLELGDQWFAIGLSTNEPERFQGHHADHLLLIVDEASGVDERIFEAAEGFLTAEGSRILLLGNPTRIGGQFHRAFTTERADWCTIHISTFDTPNYTGEQVPPAVARSLPHQGWADEKRAQWGEDSPMFQVRVLGNFPSESAYSVLSLAAVEAAQQRELAGDPTADRVTISCDVARFGDDETVIVERVGPKVRIVEHYVSVPAGTQPTVHTAGLILSHARRHQPGAVRVVVDDVGLGGGVTDLVRHRLHEDPLWEVVPVTAFNGGNRALDEDEYPNRRSEVWFAMRDRIAGLDLDSDEQLCADLTSPLYSYDPSGRRAVEPKKDTKKRLGRSPDRADAVLMSLVPPGADVIVDSTPGHRPVSTSREWAAAEVNPLTVKW